MYNSYTVRVLSRFWSIINEFYKYSIIKRVIETIIHAIKSIGSGSYVIKFFTNDRSSIENSRIYDIYQKLICFIEVIFNKVRGVVVKYKEGSLISSICTSIFDSTSRTIGTISLFVISFSIINIIIDILNNNIVTYGNIALLAITIFSIITYIYRDNIKDVILSSFIIRLIKDIFTIDDGGDQWW